MFSATVIGEGLAIAKLARIDNRVGAAARASMAATVQYGVSRVRANASGRPGPRVIFGVYRRSINGRIVSTTGGHVIGQVGTNDIRARRLELGFFGPDSLGRQYRQPPYPHFGPAIGDIAEFAERQLAAALRSEIPAA